MTLDDIQTPALVLDRGRMAANCERMQTRCRDLRTLLRPHMKTLKSIDAARYAIDRDHGGIAVATLSEAEYFADHGLKDICLAVCLPPSKFQRAARLLSRAPEFGFFIDSLSVARAAADFVKDTGASLRLWIEIDSGEHRTGLDPLGPELLDVARLIEATEGVSLAGVATHAGHAYGCRTIEEIEAVAEQERQQVVAAANRLRDAGIVVPHVSMGSTPTGLHARSAAGITEIRAGVYMAGDLFQAAIGSCRIEDIAVSVLATVISHNRTRNQIVVDAGGLALSKDRATQSTDRDMGYGLVVDIDGAPSFGDLHVVDVHQEHGEIRSDAALPFDRLPIGARVRVLPNHVCMTAAMYDGYEVVEGELDVVERWPRINGWR